MAPRRVTVFGGSGFIGRHVVERLADRGDRVIVAVRDPEAAKFLKPLGDVGQVTPVRAPLGDADAVREAVRGADAVVNLVGILYQRGRQTFRAVHVDGAGRLAQAAAEAGVSRFVQVSALGAAPEAPSAYARSRAAGEMLVRSAMPRATILRPSVVFGHDDGLLNRFAQLALIAPVLPLFGGGTTRFQPAYVADVADAIVAALDLAAAPGQIYELGGPDIVTLADLFRLVLQETGRRRCLLKLPFWVGGLAAPFLGLLPDPPLTPDQLRQLSVDNVVTPGMPGFAELGIVPTGLRVQAPAILARYLARGQR